MVSFLRRAKIIEKETNLLIARVAGGYKFALELKDALNFIEKEKEPSKAGKEAKSALQFLRWVGRAERKIDRSEKKILVEFEKIKPLISRELKTTEENLAKQLSVAESSLVRLISTFRGKLKQELEEIKLYENLLEKYLSSPAKKAYLDARLNTLIVKTQDDTEEILKWMQSTEVILKSIKNFSSRLKIFIQVEAQPSQPIVDLSRRRFLKGAAIGAAAVAAGIPQKALANSLFGNLDEDENRQLKAIIHACEQIELFCEKMTRKLSQPVIYTPHADYTHFNRVGKWTHGAILAEAETVSEDWGAHESSLFKKQRAQATAAKQPTDKEVSITERSLVTAANLVGRSRVAGKVFVPKHFPGGTPEIELTEGKEVTIKDKDEVFYYLKPFEYLCFMPETKAVMVCHVNYPELEEEYKSIIERVDSLIYSELQEYGLSQEDYSQWILSRPATLSPAIIRGLLFQQLKFKGSVFTDAMNMGSFLFAVQRFETCLDKEKLKEAKISYTATSTFSNILAIYAGIDFFLLHATGDVRFIQNYAERKPFFARCVEQAFAKYQELHSLTGKSIPQAASVAEQAAILVRNKTFPFDSAQDAWDRSGVIHRYFRSYYLAHLHN